MPTPDAFPLSAAGAGVVTAHVAVRSPSRATSTHAAMGIELRRSILLASSEGVIEDGVRLSLSLRCPAVTQVRFVLGVGIGPGVIVGFGLPLVAGVVHRPPIPGHGRQGGCAPSGGAEGVVTRDAEGVAGGAFSPEPFGVGEPAAGVAGE